MQTGIRAPTCWRRACASRWRGCACWPSWGGSSGCSCPWRSSGAGRRCSTPRPRGWRSWLRAGARAWRSPSSRWAATGEARSARWRRPWWCCLTGREPSGGLPWRRCWPSSCWCASAAGTATGWTASGKARRRPPHKPPCPGGRCGGPWPSSSCWCFPNTSTTPR